MHRQKHLNTVFQFPQGTEGGEKEMDEQTKYQECRQILSFFRTLSDEEQRIAYAILKGMRLQKDLDSQNHEKVNAKV